MFVNSGYYFIILLVLVIIGFWQSYFSKLFSGIDWAQDSYIHFHAITMLLWLAMLICQAFLIRYKQFSLHKTIGRFSYLLVPFAALSLLLLAHKQIEIGPWGLTYSRLYILFLQLSLLFAFLLAYSLAIIYRQTPALHARFMICTAITMIDPAVARLPIDLPDIPFAYQVYTFGLMDLIMLVLIFLERNQPRGRIVFPSMLVMFVFLQALNLNCTRSEIWDGFALWFAELPLT